MEPTNVNAELDDEPGMFANIRARDLSRPEDVEALFVLRTSAEVDAILVAAETLFARGDAPCRCAVMDLFSYAYTVGGDWLYEPMSPWAERLLEEARRVSDRLRAGPSDLPKELRDRALGSCVHMFWRVPHSQDGRRILEILADESHSRALTPAIYAAQMLRAPTEMDFTIAFAAEASRALVRIARREDLDTYVRGDAIRVLGQGGDPEDLRVVQELMAQLPHPMAAQAALVLLDEAPWARDEVRAVVQRWPMDSGGLAERVRSLLRLSKPEG
jgi:hypothetical protein